MYQKLQIELGLAKKNLKNLRKIKKIEAYYRIREAMNRFDYGMILRIDYGGSFGPDSDEYDSEAYAILEFFEQNVRLSRTLTKSKLHRKLLQLHKKQFSFRGDYGRCALITEHIYNEMFKSRLFKLSKKSYAFHYYYKKMHACGWPE